MTSVRNDSARFDKAERLEADPAPLHGLVLVGGQSSRMGRPKWALRYRGEPHGLALYRTVSHFCDQTFLSIRPEQESDPELSDYPHISDRFPGMGSLGGILSAMTKYPQAAWLVVACDLPFLEAGTMERLLADRDPSKCATSYRSPFDGMPEPLCAVYEPEACLRLLQTAELGHNCARKMLMNSEVEVIESRDPRELTNVNQPHEYEEAVARLRAEGQAQRE
ncbi:MAG: NTP transferase domain-containing protein [Trueperaceae bacterium]